MKPVHSARNSFTDLHKQAVPSVLVSSLVLEELSKKVVRAALYVISEPRNCATLSQRIKR